MKKIFLILVFLGLALPGFGQNCPSKTETWQNTRDSSGTLHNVSCIDPASGGVVWQNLRGLGPITIASGLSGSTDSQMTTCLSLASASGGVCDARGISGTISSNVFSGISGPLTLLLGAGTYTLGQTQVLTGSDISIRGLGPSKTIVTVSTAVDMFSIDAAASRITIEGIKFLGVSTTDTSAVVRTTLAATGSRLIFRDNLVTGTAEAVDITGSTHEFSDCVIDHNWFGPAGGTAGISAIYTTSIHNSVTNNVFDAWPNHDVYLSGNTATQAARYNVVSGNVSYNGGTSVLNGFATATQAAVSNNVISSNVIVSPSGQGIQFTQNSVGNVIQGNTIVNDATGYSIELNGSTAASTFPSDNLIEGNTITGSSFGSGPVEILNSKRNVFSGNVVAATAGSTGIHVDNSGGSFSAGNIVSSNDVNGPFSVAGIWDDPSSSDTRIFGNEFSGSPTATVACQGTRCVSSGNGDGTLAAFVAFPGTTSGAIALAAASSGSHTFSTAYPTAPVCTLTEAGTTPGTLVNAEVSSTTTTVTVTTASAVTATYNWVCSPTIN